MCLTSTGRVARYLVRQKPEQIVLACSEMSHVVRQVNCSRGVLGYKIPGYLRKSQIDSKPANFQILFSRATHGPTDRVDIEGRQGAGLLLPR